MKVCKGCEEEKRLDDFYLHKAMLDGHLNYCKECVRLRVKAHRRENDHVREYDRNRGHRGNSLAYREKYPEKYKAHMAVQVAIKNGQLTKQPCIKCGAEKVEAHHSDYSKPLEVVWLCPLHHRRLHHD